jgi:hypothetical protein
MRNYERHVCFWERVGDKLFSGGSGVFLVEAGCLWWRQGVTGGGRVSLVETILCNINVRRTDAYKQRTQTVYSSLETAVTGGEGRFNAEVTVSVSCSRSVT